MSPAHPVQMASTKLTRFVRFPLTRIAIATISLVVVLTLLQGLAVVIHVNVSPASLPIMLVAILVAPTIAALIATYIAYVRLIERRPVTELGTKGAVREGAAGVLIGGFTFGTVMLILWWAGIATIGIGAGWSAAILALFSALELVVIQTLFFWGIVFRIVEESLGTWIALALTIIVFGAAHAGGSGANIISVTTIGLEAGALLTAVYVRTRRLWMATGVLAAWNFVESGVFGVSTPGHKENGLFISQFHGAAIITGGAADPEASFVTLLLCLAVAAVFLARAHRKGRGVVPFWQRTPAAAALIRSG